MRDLRHSELYSAAPAQLHSGEYWLCFYCGAPADTVDHVPPLSRVSDYQALGLSVERYELVRCCKECNSLLGASLQETLLQRSEELKDALAKRYRRALSTPEWDEEELAELGTQLRVSVRAALTQAESARERIEY